jgi:polyisoprenoid-binding protein YceI
MSRRNMLVTALVALIVAGGAAWWFLLRSDAPPPASLDEAVAAVGSGGTGIGGDGSLDGSWAVDQATSFAGYRIDEELAGIGAATAVGRTSEIDATLEFSGSSVTAAEITVDLTTLQSDRSQRDNAIRTRGLETQSFPTAAFTLTRSIDLGSIPAPGSSFTAVAEGDLSLHGVTRPVTLDLEGSRVDDTVVIVGSTEIVLTDYDIEAPTGFSVLGIADTGLIELQLAFVPA